MTTKVTLSTSSVFPQSTAVAFEVAARLGYDGVEVMVGVDSISQDSAAIRALSQHHGIGITSLHAPCLLVTQRVWGREPWGKLVKAAEVAELVGAETVVVHPPFRWQRSYAREFVAGIERMSNESAVKFAVENMYPWRARGAEMAGYLPGWDVRDDDYAHTTLDLSHTSVSGSDAIEMAVDLGDRLVHVHLADGSGSNRDEHLIPGRGNQPVAQVLDLLRMSNFDGHVVVEVSTRSAVNAAEREADLAEALAFARRGLTG